MGNIHHTCVAARAFLKELGGKSGKRANLEFCLEENGINRQS